MIERRDECRFDGHQDLFYGVYILSDYSAVTLLHIPLINMILSLPPHTRESRKEQGSMLGVTGEQVHYRHVDN